MCPVPRKQIFTGLKASETVVKWQWPGLLLPPAMSIGVGCGCISKTASRKRGCSRPHASFVLFFLLFFSGAAKDDNLVCGTLSPDLALLKSSCKRGRKFCFVFNENRNKLGKVRTYKEKAILSSYWREGNFSLSCQVSSFPSTVFSMPPFESSSSLGFLHWDRLETCSQ